MEHYLSAPHSLDRSSARLVDIGNTLHNYRRISIQQTVPTRMKVLYSWNLDNWHAPKQPKRDVRMRKSKRLLAKGPICLQETKWSASEKEVLMQHIPGLQIAESLATSTPGGHWSFGVAVLVPPGYVLKDSHNLVQRRAVAALIADRTSHITLCLSISTQIKFDRTSLLFFKHCRPCQSRGSYHTCW